MSDEILYRVNTAGDPEWTEGRSFDESVELCEKMWGGAFTYVPASDTAAYDLAYTMWWFTADNPNDATTNRRIDSGLHKRAFACKHLDQR